MKILIHGGRMINPKYGTDQILDIELDDGVITAIGTFDPADYAHVVNATGKWVTPAFVDTHVHLREPGFEQKEDLITGTRAALKGGFSDILCMPNTNPVTDTLERYKELKTRVAKKAFIHVHAAGAITMGLKGETQAEMEEMAKAGALAFTDDGRTTMDDVLMKNAFLVAKTYDRVITTHSEDHDVTATIKHKPAPNTAESDIVQRDIRLAKETGAALHVGHISTEEAIEAVRKAKANGVDVSCEVTPHHIALADGVDGVKASAARYKVNPPVRSPKDREAVLKAIQDGTIEMIATDHAPHEMRTKRGTYEEASYGFTGLETSFAVCYTALVKSGLIEEAHLIKLMTYGPAERFGIQAGAIEEGQPATIAIIDPKASWTVHGQTFESKGKNTPFEDRMLYGRVTDVWIDGKQKLVEGDIQHA